MNLQSSIEINAPAEEIFSFLVEPEKLRLWLGGFVSSRTLEGNDHAVGSKAAVTIEENGKTREMVSEVLAIEPNRRLTVDVSGGPIKTVSDYRLSQGSGQNITLHHEMDAKFSGIMGLLTPIFKGVVKKKMDNDLSSLKAAVEQK